MKSYNLKKTFAGFAFSLVAVLGLSVVASAQWHDKKPNGRSIQDHKPVIVKHPPQQPVMQNRWRVYRDGRYYNTDNRGADLLRQAVREGYRQGYQTGQMDRRNRRGGRWNNNQMYRSGNYGYQSYVDRRQYQYYFQQGFERGYQDGFNSRQQYGRNNNGSVNILGNILSGILNLQQY